MAVSQILNFLPLGTIFRSLSLLEAGFYLTVVNLNLTSRHAYLEE